MEGQDFREALADLRMSQRAFSAKSKMAVSSVNRWVKGSQPIPGWVPWLLDMLRERREIADKLAGR